MFVCKLLIRLLDFIVRRLFYSIFENWIETHKCNSFSSFFYDKKFDTIEAVELKLISPQGNSVFQGQFLSNFAHENLILSDNNRYFKKFHRNHEFHNSLSIPKSVIALRHDRSTSRHPKISEIFRILYVVRRTQNARSDFSAPKDHLCLILSARRPITQVIL